MPDDACDWLSLLGGMGAKIVMEWGAEHAEHAAGGGKTRL